MSEPSLYDWQTPHVDRLVSSLRRHKVAKDGSDTGTGKTVMALSAAKEMGLRPLVICPKSVIPVWREWHEAFFPGAEPLVFNYEALRMGKTKYVTRRGKSKRFDWHVDPSKVVLVFDEDHRCKGEKSLNSKMLVAAKGAKIPLLLLSATSCSDPTEMKALGFALGMHRLVDWWTWCGANGCRRGHWGGLTFRNDPGVLRRFHEHIYGNDGRGSRIRIRELGDRFPANQISADAYRVDDPAAIDSIYGEMREELEAFETGKAFDSDNPLVIQLRARQKVELLKVPTFVELAADALAEGNSVVVFVNFRATLAAIDQRLEANAFVKESETVSLIHGDQTGDARQGEIDRFQSNRSRVCICMVQAGGVGLSLHDATGDHPRVSLISPGFSAIDLRQALGRIHRATGMSPARQRIVFASGTVEDGVCAAVRRKLNNLDLINDAELNPIL